MVDAALRIRLEGRVEELERALLEWAAALKAARKRHFTQAAEVLQRGEVQLADHGDPALAKLLETQTSLRRRLERLVAGRLHLLGMPSIDRARGAAWLVAEPVLYEHHRLSSAFLLRIPHTFAFLAIPAFLISRAWVPLGVMLFVLLGWTVVTSYGWSEVVLTARRLIVEGEVIDLTRVKSIHLVRPWLQYGLFSFELEIRSRSGHFTTTRIRYAPTTLRTALTRLNIETGRDWGPW